MKVLIVGAAGGIGKLLVERAVAAGHEVTALARNPKALASNPKVRAAPGDVMNAALLESAMAGQEAVLSAIGSKDRASTIRSDSARNLIAAMKKQGVRRIAVVSALGVADSLDQAKRASFVFGRIIIPLFLARPFADMAKMEALLRESGLDWTAVRPTALTDKPARGQVTALLDGSRAGTSIPRADVAAFMVEQLDKPDFIQKLPSLC